jgi:hypothetical protein
MASSKGCPAICNVMESKQAMGYPPQASVYPPQMQQPYPPQPLYAQQPQQVQQYPAVGQQPIVVQQPYVVQQQPYVVQHTYPPPPPPQPAAAAPPRPPPGQPEFLGMPTYASRPMACQGTSLNCSAPPAPRHRGDCKRGGVHPLRPLTQLCLSPWCSYRLTFPRLLQEPPRDMGRCLSRAPSAAFRVSRTWNGSGGRPQQLGHCSRSAWAASAHLRRVPNNNPLT